MTTIITNQTHQTNFRLDIPDNNATVYFSSAVQRASVPGIEIEPVTVPVNPLLPQAMMPSSMFRFDPLNMSILVDENLESYIEIYKWMLSINDYRELNSTATQAGIVPRTILFHILDNSHNKTVCTFRFFDAWPSSLGELPFTYMEEGNMPVNCDVTFQYKSFEIEKDGVIITPRKITPEQKYTESKGGHPLLR